MYEQREKPKETIKNKNRPDTRSVVTNRVRHFNDYDEARGDYLGHPTNGGLNGLLQRQPKGRVRSIVPDYFRSQSSTIQRVDEDEGKHKDKGQTDNTSENLDNLQLSLELLGMTPGVGMVADAANVGISLLRGNYADALINLAAMVPLVGQAVTGTKLGTKAVSTVADTLAVTKKTTAGDIAAEADKVTEAATGLAKEMSDKLPIPVEGMKGVFKAEHTGKAGTMLGKDVVPDKSTVHKFDNLDDFNRAANSPKPNSQYEHGGYIWKADSQGRVIEGAGKVKLQKADGRSGTDGVSTVKIGKEGQEGDIGFHLIGDQFDGPTNRLNVVPGNGKRVDQNGPPNLNQGQYAKFERSVKKAMQNPENAGKDIEIKISPQYAKTNTSNRPDAFVASYKVAGEKSVKFKFKNQQGG